jgi:hypothetical protein
MEEGCLKDEADVAGVRGIMAGFSNLFYSM